MDWIAGALLLALLGYLLVFRLDWKQRYPSESKVGIVVSLLALALVVSWWIFRS
jgi:hypothetical protein